MAEAMRGGVPSRLRQALKRALTWAVPKQALLVQGPPDSYGVCLTFDDGPHPVHTPRVLDALDRFRIPATFFVVGAQAARHPELVRRIAEEGHVVANHSWFHAPPDEVGAPALLAEVERTASLLSDLTGTRPTLFRPPHGKLSAAKLLGLWRAGQSVVLWNVDPRDYEADSPDEVRAFLAQHPWQGGDVVLLHDVHPNAAGLVPVLAEAIRARGLRFTTPGALVPAPPSRVQAA